MNRKKLLIINRQPAYGSSTAQAAFELLLAANAFAQEVSVLFIDEGVWQLVSNQDHKIISQKNMGAQLQSLPIYEINNIYVEKVALQERGLVCEDLLLAAKTLTSAEIAELTTVQDVVLSF